MKNILKRINKLDQQIFLYKRDISLLTIFSDKPTQDRELQKMIENLKTMYKRKYNLLENLELTINKEKSNISYCERDINLSQFISKGKKKC